MSRLDVEGRGPDLVSGFLLLFSIVTFPRSPLPRDKPDFALSSHQWEKTPVLQIFFISGRFFSKDQI